MYNRLLTGLNQQMSPSVEVRLMILLIEGNRISMQLTTRGVSIESSEQEFSGVASTGFWTSDSFSQYSETMFRLHSR